MRNNIITIISMYCILMSSCQEDQKNHTYQQKTSETNINQESYLYEENKDTILLSLAKTENSISGKLDILRFQKDSRRGTIHDGRFTGDTLFAIYQSMQEGQISACEIAFLRKGDVLILSNDIFGENNYQYNDDYSKGRFKDKQLIKFDGDTLKKITSMQ